MKKRKRVALEYGDQSNPELVAEARRLKTKLEGDTTFDTLDSETTSLGTAATTLESTNIEYEAAQDLADQKLAEVNIARAIVEAKISVLGSGVEHIAAGDTAIVLRSGFKPQAEPAPVGPLGSPLGVEAIMSAYEGQLKVRWKKLRGARSYVVEYSLEGSGIWKQACLCTKASATIDGLESGKKYRVRISGIGAAGQGPWSDEAVKMAA